MRLILGLALLAAALGAPAQEREIQRALIQRDQQSAEFAARLRDPGAGTALEGLHARQLLDVIVRPPHPDPQVARLLEPYQRQQMTSERALVVARVFTGISEAFILVIGSVLICDYYRGQARERWFAAQTFVTNSVGLLGYWIGEKFALWFGWQGPFFVAAHGLLLAFVFARVLWEPRDDSHELDEAEAREQYRKLPFQRMLGIGLTSQKTASLANAARPWLLRAIALMLATGIPLFMSEAVKCYWNMSFRVKMVALPVALAFTFLVKQRVAMNEDLEGSNRSRLVAVGSIAIWFTVAMAGRWIGFSA